MNHFKTRLLFLFGIIIFFIPFFISNNYFLHLLITAIINIIMVLGLNLLVGLTGQVSLGHAAFYGLGAYAAALISVNFNLEFIFTIFAGVILSTIVGTLLGFPAARLKGPYLAMVTLGFGQIFQLLAVNLKEITKGPLGVIGIKPITFFGHELNSIYENYFMISICLLIGIIIFYRLKNGPIGRAWIAIKESEIAADSMGLNTTYYKVLSFAICSAYAGAAGVLWAHYSLYISPDQFPFGLSFTLISMIVIGGRGNILGSILGATILTFLPEYMRPLGDLRHILYALVVIGIVLYAPGGIVEIILKIKNKIIKNY